MVGPHPWQVAMAHPLLQSMAGQVGQACTVAVAQVAPLVGQGSMAAQASLAGPHQCSSKAAGQVVQVPACTAVGQVSSRSSSMEAAQVPQVEVLECTAAVGQVAAGQVVALVELGQLTAWVAVGQLRTLSSPWLSCPSRV